MSQLFGDFQVEYTMDEQQLSDDLRLAESSGGRELIHYRAASIFLVGLLFLTTGAVVDDDHHRRKNARAIETVSVTWMGRVASG